MVHLQSQRIWCHMVTHCHLITILNSPPAVTTHTVPHGYTLPLDYTVPCDYNPEWSTCSHNAYSATYTVPHGYTTPLGYTVPCDSNTEWSTCSHNAYSATWLHNATWLQCHMITVLNGPPVVTTHTVPHGYTVPCDYIKFPSYHCES